MYGIGNLNTKSEWSYYLLWKYLYNVNGSLDLCKDGVSARDYYKVCYYMNWFNAKNAH